MIDIDIVKNIIISSWMPYQEGTYLISHHGAHVVEGHPVVAKGTVPYAKEGDVSDDSDDKARSCGHDGAARQESRIVRYDPPE